jgi:hypothetical protein
MAWFLALTLLIASMVTLEGLCAERNFSRRPDPLELRDWHAALPEELRTRHN